MPINRLLLSLLIFCCNSIAKHCERVDRLICTSLARTQYLGFTVKSKNLTSLCTPKSAWEMIRMECQLY